VPGQARQARRDRPPGGPVETLRNVVVYLHLIGFALLLGGSVAQYLSGKLRINLAMLGGAVIQVVTGLVLAAPWGLSPGEELNDVKLAVKLVVALMILAMTYFSRNREKVNRGHFLAIIVLVLLNAGIAIFWT
jgi:dipeptide/tripeptide permease